MCFKAQFGGYWLVLLVFNYGCEAVDTFGTVVLNLNPYVLTVFLTLFILNNKGRWSMKYPYFITYIGLKEEPRLINILISFYF